VKNLECFHYFFVFEVKNLNKPKSAKRFKFFTCFLSEKGVKNNEHFSPNFSLQNLKCSTSELYKKTKQAHCTNRRRGDAEWCHIGLPHRAAT
jgi:hypothetical protein